MNISRLQKKILKLYNDTFGKRTLQEISQDTGLQISRVHRILKGAEMKITEFEKFSKSVAKAKKMNLKLFLGRFLDAKF